ncbi:response regulator [Desulfonatronum parangueonense]
MKILIVDDEMTNRVIMQTFLKNRASFINTATNGEEAVMAFTMALEEKDPYDLIMLDIMMPVMDGHTALQKIREIEKNHGVQPGKEVKVVMVTCLEDQKNVCRAFFHGMATSYLTKPLTKEALDNALDNLSS